jgi:hypothetical protein
LKLDRKLNIVLTVETETSGQVFVHSTPISREVFRKYFREIGKTFAELFSGGLSVIAGPGLAYLMLEKTAQDMGTWEGSDGVANGLINEIVRLSAIMVSGPEGWKSQPLQTAITRKLLSQDELEEVLSELVFFTCVSSVNKSGTAEGVLRSAHTLWGSQATALGSTAFLNSLQTSTVDLPANTASDSAKTS